MRTQYKHADYMKVLQPEEFRKSMRIAEQKFKEFKTPFDAIAFSGMSGAIFVPTLALHLEVEMIMVRKEYDCNKKEQVNHSGMRVEGFSASKRYVIVDDLTSSGDTMRRIHREIKTFAPDAVCVGVYTYYHERFEKGLRFVYSDDKIEDAVLVAEADDPTVAPCVGVVRSADGMPVSAPFGGPANLSFSWGSPYSPESLAKLREVMAGALLFEADASSAVPPDGDDEHFSGESS